MADNENQLLALSLLNAELAAMKEEREVRIDDLLVLLGRIERVTEEVAIVDRRTASLCANTRKLVSSARRLARGGYVDVSLGAANAAVSHLVLRGELFW